MVMNLFSSKEASVAELVSRKKYAQAAELLKQQFIKRPNDMQLRIQLADVLSMDGKTSAAIGIMEQVAEQFANDGFTTKAVAALKRIEKLDPSRDISAKLRELVKDMGASQSRQPAASDRTEQQAPETGLDTSEFVAVDSGAAVKAVAAAESPSPPATEASAQRQSSGLPASPLFASFPEDELLEVLHGFQILSFEPGDIIVTEGEVGDSLFVIANGFVRAWIRATNGSSVRISEMHEGEFFGEIALLTHRPRSATVIAAAHSELLEFDRATLDSIAQRRPHIRKVILDVYNARADNAAEAIIRGIDIQEPTAESAPADAVTLVEPDPPEASLAELKEGAIAAMTASDFEEAFGLWTRLLERSPDDRQALNALGLASAKLMRWDATASAFERLVKQTPNDPGAHFSLGVAYWRLSRLDDAKRSFRKTLELKPDHEKAAQSLAKLGG